MYLKIFTRQVILMIIILFILFDNYMFFVINNLVFDRNLTKFYTSRISQETIKKSFNYIFKRTGVRFNRSALQYLNFTDNKYDVNLKQKPPSSATAAPRPLFLQLNVFDFILRETVIVVQQTYYLWYSRRIDLIDCPSCTFFSAFHNVLIVHVFFFFIYNGIFSPRPIFKCS